MNEESLKRLDVLAAKLGVGSGEVWRITLKEAHIEGWVDLSLALLLIGVFIAALWVRNKLQLEERDPFPVISYALTLVAAIFLGYFAVCELANPEYWALHSILSALK